MGKLLVVGAFAISLCGVAAAHPHHDRNDGRNDRRDDDWHKVVAAPEVSADSAAAAVALLVGSLVVLRGRKPTR